jgi:hypothetical protein
LLELDVEIFLRASPEFLASLQHKHHTTRSSHSLQKYILGAIDVIATSDFRMAELFSFANTHFEDVQTVPDKINRNSSLFYEESGKYLLAQANEANAADFMQLIPTERRFGLLILCLLASHVCSDLLAFCDKHVLGCFHALFCA